MNNGTVTSEDKAFEKTFPKDTTLDDYLAQHFGGPRTEENAQQWDRKKDEMDREARLRASIMSPKGKLGLPPLLDARRLEWLITDGAFAIAPLFNRVHIHQIPRFVNKKKGLIHMPDTVAHSQLRACHRGILVSAGALALDALRSNGVDLGHVVHFVHVNPLRLFVDYAEGLEPQVLVMTVDCVESSEDLAEAIRNEKCRVVMGEDGKHRYINKDGTTWDPQMPQGVEVW